MTDRLKEPLPRCTRTPEDHRALETLMSGNQTQAEGRPRSGAFAALDPLLILIIGGELAAVTCALIMAITTGLSGILRGQHHPDRRRRFRRRRQQAIWLPPRSAWTCPPAPPPSGLAEPRPVDYIGTNAKEGVVAYGRKPQWVQAA